MHPSRGSVALLLALVLLAGVAVAAGEEAPVPIDRWLLLGPAASPLPAFHGEPAGRYSRKDLLELDDLGTVAARPRAGDLVRWAPGGELRWEPAEPRKDGAVRLGGRKGGAEAAYLAAYLQVERFTEASLAVRSHHLLRVDLDGETVARKKGATEADEDSGEEPEPGEAKAELDLEPGVHRLLVKALREPDCARPWTVAAELSSAGAEVVVRRIPDHPLELAQVLDAPQPAGVAASPGGDLVAVTVRRVLPGTDDSESWVEVRRVADGTLERTYRGGSMSAVGWSPVGRRLSYVTRDDGKATLWVADLDHGRVEPIVERVEHLGRYRWAPDGSSLIYSVSVEAEEDEHGIQRLRGLRDRRKGWRDRSYLHQVTVPQGAHRRLTAGELTTSAGALSPDGRRLLFTRTVDDYETRPYVRDELFVLDMQTLEPRLLYRGDFFRSAAWSPDGKRLLVVAGPSAFDGAGRAVPEGTVANDYDGQIYLLDPETGEAQPLSREFDPSIDSAEWHHGDGRIYLTVTEGPRRLLYRFDPASRRYTRLETAADVIGDLDLALHAPLAVYTASGALLPPRVFALDLAGGAPRELDFPGAGAFEDVRLGEVRSWSFRSRRGVEIEGRVYTPPGFDPDRRYPAIVYYYGGTAPTSRDFGGRYPKNLWAAHGYVVYVLQPSGTVGYGQEYSALHVNDWGRITGEDILEGVDRFLEAHPFVDPDRLGCIGASYGGFMTQYLLTRTDRFAAGVSHAGISFLGSYWGEGYWGYAYSGVASAGSFPWNRGELYVGHSPLFHADRIHTPLLLLHGTADTNVPAGESEQLYTALKLLGREVEYVRVEGQDHHILKHDQRILWSKTILAWFDRWLKEQPEWWDHLYPGPGAEEEE